MKCKNEAHHCVFALCPNHAIYSQEDIADNYCYKHMIQDMKEGGWGKSWKEAGWYRERCKQRKPEVKKEFGGKE